jgi:UDP-N-acetyl-D-mannosaminuronate dehydrogenase
MTTDKKADAKPMNIPQIAQVLREKFVAVASEVANAAHPELVVQEVIKDLNEQKREVTLRLLGLDARYGKWEVDHCNGRTSPITQYLEESTKELIKQWVNEAVTSVLTEDFKHKTMTAARTALKKEIADIVRYDTTGTGLRERAHGVVDELMRRVADEVRKELSLPVEYDESFEGDMK